MLKNKLMLMVLLSALANGDGSVAIANDQDAAPQENTADAPVSKGAQMRSTMINTMLIQEQQREAAAEAERIKQVGEIAKNTNDVIKAERTKIIEEYALELARKYPYLFLKEEVDLTALNSILASERGIPAPAEQKPEAKRVEEKAPEPVATIEPSAPKRTEPVVLEVWGTGVNTMAEIELPNGRPVSVKVGDELYGYGHISLVSLDKVQVILPNNTVLDILPGVSSVDRERQKQALVDEVRRKLMQQSGAARRGFQ